MKSFLKKSWLWLVMSSADPKKASLAVKSFGAMFLTFFSAYILPTLTISCSQGHLCEYADPAFVGTLDNLIQLASDIVFYGLMTASIVCAFLGTARKLILTLTGDNEVLKQ